MNERDRNIRFIAIREIGCIACRMHGIDGHVPPQVHHLNFGDRHGGKRLGDEYTVGLCVWHHVGQPFDGMWPGQCREKFGPSWAREPKLFRETFGDGARLLEYQNTLIARWHGTIVRGDNMTTGETNHA